MLEKLKEDVIRVARQAQREGLCRHRSGNFSARDPKSGFFVVTPTGMDREKLTVDDMVVMDMDAVVIENRTGLRPTSEALMHIAVYEERPDLRAIVHTHSLYATSFAVLDRPIPGLVYEMFQMGCSEGKIPVAPYGRPGTVALADSVRGPIRTSDCLLLKGHGALAADETDIDGALLRAEYIEEMAQMYYIALTANGGKEPETFPAAELQRWAYPQEITFRS